MDKQSTSRAPFADLNEIKALCRIALDDKVMMPPSLIDTIIRGQYNFIQNIYNGAGPDSMMDWQRSALTWLLRRYKVPVMIHDWRFTQIVKFKEVLQQLVGKALTEFDLVMVLEDWHFVLPDGQTDRFLGNWRDVDIFMPTDYERLMACLWHDTNREFYDNMKLFEVSAWLLPVWCYSRFKTYSAYQACESSDGRDAWLS